MNTMKKIAAVLLSVLLVSAYRPAAQPAGQAINFIIILADDLGYGDLGCYGHPTISTPHLNELAREGTRFTQFYVAANVCSPSRAALLTGRLPARTGITGGLGVFFPHSSGGLPTSEITIARALSTKGYRTAIIGKWHLGSLPQYLPNAQGFGYYFGIPYSNDMIPDNAMHVPYPPLPLYRNQQVIEQNPDQHLLTRRYTEEALQFIKSNKNKPFFLYYANNAPHVPLYASDSFAGKSKRGTYGDVVEELDWSVGRIIATLKEEHLDQNTFVLFLSDNGPWLTQLEAGGSAGTLRDGKGSDFDGGMRVPAIAWWPGVVPADRVNSAIVSSLDVFPTLLHWANTSIPGDRPFDGADASDVFSGKKDSARDVIYYYASDKLYAVRKGPWKAHFTTHPGYSPEAPQRHDPPLLYNIENDPSEKYEIGGQHPDIIARLKEIYSRQIATVIPAPSELAKFQPGPLDDIFKARSQQKQQNKSKQD